MEYAEKKYLLPDSLVGLIQSGFWPQCESEKGKRNQDFDPILKGSLIRELTKTTDYLVLYTPPFITLETLLLNGEPGSGFKLSFKLLYISL